MKTSESYMKSALFSSCEMKKKSYKEQSHVYIEREREIRWYHQDWQQKKNIIRGKSCTSQWGNVAILQAL